MLLKKPWNHLPTCAKGNLYEENGTTLTYPGPPKYNDWPMFRFKWYEFLQVEQRFIVKVYNHCQVKIKFQNFEKKEVLWPIVYNDAGLNTNVNFFYDYCLMQMLEEGIAH